RHHLRAHAHRGRDRARRDRRRAHADRGAAEAVRRRRPDDARAGRPRRRAVLLRHHPVNHALELGLLAGAGLFGGFVNTLAGGGSIVMVPAMMVLSGMPANIANATSRVPIFAQCATSTVAFARAKRLEAKPALDVTPLTIVGAIA